MHFLKLIRWFNLLIIVVTQYAMRYWIIEPMLVLNNFKLQLSNLYFALIVLCTVLIAAAGYIINDYFDVRIDSINKPTANVIGVHIKRRVAMMLHTVLNIVAIAIAFYVSYSIGNYKLTIIFVIATGMLWFYSTNFKKQLIIGNIVTSLLTAAIPLIVGLYELPLLNKFYLKELQAYNFTFNYIAYFIIAFSFFAFIVSLIREIIKDTEDTEGDKAYGCETLPIVFGKKVTLWVVLFLVTSVIVLLVYLQFRQIASKDLLSVYYIITVIEIPLIIVFYLFTKATTRKQYHTISTIVKCIMLAGILYSFVIYFELNSQMFNNKQVEQPLPQLQINGGF